MAGSKEKQELKCPNCDFVTKRSFYAKQELGRHLRFKHGVGGKSTSAKIMQAKKEHIAAKAAGESGKTRYEQLTEPKEKRRYQKRSPIDGNEAQVFITVGKITAYCEAEAKKLGLSEESFTRRCAELFFASQIRT